MWYKRFSKHFYLQQLLTKLNKHRGKKIKEAGSGRASPDLGQIGPAGSPAIPGGGRISMGFPSVRLG
jgi:hypothetical protein